MKKIGFIGVGNMGLPMMKGAIQAFGNQDILYTDVNEDRLRYVENVLNIPYLTSNEQCIVQSDMIVLAIKPQFLKDALEKLKGNNLNDKIFISIAPGIHISKIKEILGEDIRVVRAMPNTPAMVLAGMSAICFSSDRYTDDDRDFIFQFFNSFGETVELNEKQLDMVVPVSGSSPAYVYMLIEAMADAGVLFGLPRDVAYKLAAQSVYGSAKMVLETGEHPGALKDAVCSPGGTTIEAVSSLERTGFRSSIIEAMKVCYEKTLSFSK
ncbi:MAG: pyrroline-5-carboxylate reductase [Firmicutes bacterium HGW-Firmicutes-1]|jgi:pyrroline-5-carboxylate reductase|nr:MAG: pyrroline-5-carboxylate reductase [Firmicutes bacterium HGW-Firmicutes-1]